MRLGAESRAKLVLAVVLLAAAIYLLVRTFGGGGGAPAAAATPARPSVAQPAPAQAARARRVRGRATVRGTATQTPVTASLDPRLRLDLLRASESTSYKGTGRNIFRAEELPPIPEPVKNPVKSVQNTPPPQPPGPPPPPPINLKYFGLVNEPGQQTKAFLSQDNEVFVAAQGDIVNRRYKVVRIGPTSVEIEDMLSNNRQTIPLTQG